MRRVLWWLLGGSRGGRNRLRVIRTLHETPMNAHQLSQALELDYKTTRHHLELLCENDVLTTMGDDYGKTYFLSDRMEANLDVLEQVASKAGLDDVPAADRPSREPSGKRPSKRGTGHDESDHREGDGAGETTGGDDGG
jgi:DNA-binding transcriptional ArsR family regulator